MYNWHTVLYYIQVHIIMIRYLYILWNNSQNNYWLRLLLQPLPQASHMSILSRTQYPQGVRPRNLSCFQVPWPLLPDPSQCLWALSLILWPKIPDCSEFSSLELWLPAWISQRSELIVNFEYTLATPEVPPYRQVSSSWEQGSWARQSEVYP